MFTTAKPEYPENRETSDTFFSWIFPKIIFPTSPFNKKSLIVDWYHNIVLYYMNFDIYLFYIFLILLYSLSFPNKWADQSIERWVKGTSCIWSCWNNDNYFFCYYLSLNFFCSNFSILFYNLYFIITLFYCYFTFYFYFNFLFYFYTSKLCNLSFRHYSILDKRL